MTAKLFGTQHVFYAILSLVLCYRTLAGSTIMLLTIPWAGAMILGRVDIVDKSGIDGQVSKFKPSSFWKSVKQI